MLLMLLLSLVMRLRLRPRRPAVSSLDLPVQSEHPGPRSGIKVLGSPAEGRADTDGPDWHIVHECESVRLLPPDRDLFDDPPEAGYRWGSLHVADGHSTSTGTEVLLAPTGDNLPAPRFERAVVALAARTEVLATTVERMEERLDHIAERLFDAASQSDLIELEARRARLAAEVSRLSVELRAELDRRLGELARAMATVNHRSASVDHLGPLDLADARRVEIQLDRMAGVTALEDYRTA
jgi:predicted transcriptional regulator